MVTRKDVAVLAGVSPAVVSYVLNNSNYVSEEKRKAVLEAVEKLNYQPNYIGKSLRDKKTYNLGLVCDDIRGELFAEIAHYSECYAYQKGYKLFLCTSHQDDRFLRSMTNHRLDGIFLGTSIYSSDQINQMAENGIPIVLYKAKEYDHLDPRVRCLEIDYTSGTYEITRHLLDQGFEKAAYMPPYLSGVNVWREKDYRFKGYCRALAEFGMDMDEHLVSFDTSSYEAILDKAETLLREAQREKKRIAFVTGNDYLAIRIMQRFKELRLYDPSKIAITGMDNTASSRIVTPTLTTLDFSKEEIARLAIDLLVDKTVVQKNSVRIPTTVVKRESSDGSLKSSRKSS
ncbi:MAG: LacI family DNA-binding transcriptional regulator [Eubacteriales bacterium]|nr:LacI family DNA-binding transcriptional regulator [Eubacteriales bacterium]